MKQKKIPSTIPIYGLGVVWVLYCLFFPLYRGWHFLLCAAVSAFTWLILKLIYPGKAAESPAPQQEELAQLMVRGESAVAEFHSLNAAIPDEELSRSLAQIERLTEQIFQKVQEDNGDLCRVRRFMDYYLPTTLKLLRKYVQLQAAPVETENVTHSKAQIGGLIQEVETAFQKQLNSLYEKDLVDITAEIQVMESLMEREGLTENSL